MQDIDKAILKNIDIDIDKDILENIDIDIDKEILEDIDEISNQLEFGKSNRAIQTALSSFPNLYLRKSHSLRNLTA